MVNHDAHGQGDAHGAHGGHAFSLDDILHELNPTTIGTKVTTPFDQARESFEVSADPITDYAAFVRNVSDYVKHAFKKVNNGGEVSDAYAFGEAEQHLEAVFQNEGGFNHAFDLAKEGRMTEVLNALNRRLKAVAESRHTKYQLEGRIDPRDTDKQAQIVRTLFTRLGALMPEGTQLGNPDHFVAQYKEVIGNYSRMVNDLTRVYGRHTDHQAANTDHEAGHGAHAAHGAAHHG